LEILNQLQDKNKTLLKLNFSYYFISFISFSLINYDWFHCGFLELSLLISWTFIVDFLEFYDILDFKRTVKTARHQSEFDITSIQ